MLRRVLLLACVVCFGCPAAALAQGPPIFGGFHSVLAFGEGEGTSPQDLAAFEAGGTPPRSDVSQVPQYEGLEQAWPGLTPSELPKYYKTSGFQARPSARALSTLLGQAGLPLADLPTPPIRPPVSLPLPGTGTASPPSLSSIPSALSNLLSQASSSATGSPPPAESPHAGVLIVRDSTFSVPRIYGDTRAETMWGAGYATAEDRLFLMDVLRHTAEGTTAELLGPSAAAADSTQLGLQDDSAQELTGQMKSLPRTMGSEGGQALSDVEQYVAGINAYIDLTRIDPAKLPAEYPALGILPQRWTLADTAALGVYLIGQFTVFGGQQPQQAEALALAERRLGARAGSAVYRDFRLAADPEAVVTLRHRFASDATGPANPRSVALIDPGSLVARSAETGAPVTGPPPLPSPSLPAWAQRLATTGLHLPHDESNAVLVDGRHSGTGQALAVMGPQVGYYTPEVFLEYELHGPGIDVSGVSFPGSSPYPLIGHGIDFAWTGTSAFSDNEDVFAERLCNPDGSRASFASSHYLYRGRCIAFGSRTIVEHTPLAPTNPGPPETITLRTLRSVHGPVGRFATVHGAPVALSIAAATNGHEARSYVSFMRLAENRPTSPQSFVAAMRAYTGSENWFYVDRRHIAVLQSGWFPLHAAGSDPDLPIWGTGRWDWRGYEPSSHDYQRLPDAANPTAVDPAQGYLVNWNNAIAHGWRVAAGDWSNGPVHRATILSDLLRSALRRGPLNLAALTDAVTAPSLTADLRGMADWPRLRRVIGRSADGRVRALVSLLDGWARAGSQRRAAAGSNLVAHSPAVLLMDTWWPMLVRAEFEPALGQPLLDLIDKQFNQVQPDGIRDGTGNGFFAGWEMDVQRDLRQVLRRPVRGRFSRTYCGGGSLRRCRSLLTRTLLAAAAALEKSYGPSSADWKLPVTCAVSTPPACDQIVPTSAGAISIPPQPFDNRGTFYQAVAINGHR